MSAPRRRLAAVPDTPRRGTALIRVSKAKGRDDLTSPHLQRTAIESYATAHGIDVLDWVEALDESASRVVSAWWARLDRAVAQVETGERDVVLVWKFSRAARQRRKWAVALDRIELAGGSLESATEGVDATTSTGRLARGMLAELSAWEAEVKGEQWKETQERRRNAGLPHSGQRRFGYVYTKGAGYSIEPETAPILAECYRRYLAGEGHTTLAKWLNSRGVPPMRGSKTGWSVQATIRLLDSGFAAGLLKRNDGSYLPGAQAPIIDRAMWDRYVEQRRQRWSIPARVRQPSYSLTGLVKCGQCGKAMVVASTAKQGPGYIYRCTTRMTGGQCRGAFVTRTQLEAFVVEWLRGIVAQDVDQRSATKTARAAAAASLRLDAKSFGKELATVQRNLDRARELVVDGTLTRAEYQAEKTRLETRRDEVDLELGRLKTEVAWLTGPMMVTAKGLLRDWKTLEVKDRRDLLATLVRRIEVRPGVRGAQDIRVRPMWEPDEG